MVHAAATCIWLFLIGLLAMQGVGAGTVALGAAICVVLSVRFFGVERASFEAVLSALGSAGVRAPDVVRGALRTLRAAASADVTLRPALVQVKARADDDFRAAALVGAVSAAPGAVAVDAGDDMVLVHVNEENDDSAQRLSAIAGRQP